ncbi:MAG TPA: hypothetical protein VN004_20805 [Pseudorhodoplanes sp.]|nr:hypothetical protein [Pseudorhodoplanes sp.]
MDRYAYWRAALRGERPEANPDNPQDGYYRVRDRKGGPLVPVAVWFENDRQLCVIGGKLVDETTACERWPYFADKPISHEVYTAVADRGENWPDIDDTVADQQRAGIGGNNPPEDEAIILQEQIEAAAAGANAYAKITDDATLAKAQTLRSRLLELSRTADKRREDLKRPHMEAGKAVDAKWQPLVKMAKSFADSIAAAMNAWETEKLRREREEQRKAEEAARKAAEAGRPAPVAPAPPPAPAPIKGAAGRAASVKLVRIATVTDQDAVYRYMRDRPEVVELLAKLAQRAVDAGRDVPGVKIEEARRVA